MDNKKINIAVFIGSTLNAGGGYQYEYMVLDILKKCYSDKNINIKFYSNKVQVKEDYKSLDIDINIIKENIFHKIHRAALQNLLLYKIFSKIGLKYSKIESILIKDNIDLIYFLYPSMISLSLNKIPYIFTLWDLGHLDILEFPEVSKDQIFESRELLYSKSLKKAFRVTVDSNYGKELAVKKYNLDENRVSVLKLLPNIQVVDANKHIDIKQKYNIKNDFIFYPAQFWPHKNHIYILEAIKLLRENQKIDLDVIFSGSRTSHLDYVLQKAKDYKIEDLIHYIGFVEKEEIPSLYKQSQALVMPTYLGPTNIPPLEAFFYKVPVCYSDLPYFREQTGEAAFYFDLKNPQSLSDILLSIIKDKSICIEKISNGQKILDAWTKDDFKDAIKNIFSDYQYVRMRWH